MDDGDDELSALMAEFGIEDSGTEPLGNDAPLRLDDYNEIGNWDE